MWLRCRIDAHTHTLACEVVLRDVLPGFLKMTPLDNDLVEQRFIYYDLTLGDQGR